MRPIFRLLLLVGAGLLPAACGDDPFQLRWEENPQEVTLYSVSRPELNLPTAFNFVARRTLPLESPTAAGNWDLAVDVRDGVLVFLTPGALGIRSRASIAPVVGTTFKDLREAPSDTTRYISDRPVPVEAGTIYAIQTHEEAGSFGSVCVYYAKVEPRRIDPVEGVLTFLYDASPVCNSRRLVPPDS